MSVAVLIIDVQRNQRPDECPRAEWKTMLDRIGIFRRHIQALGVSMVDIAMVDKWTCPEELIGTHRDISTRLATFPNYQCVSPKPPNFSLEIEDEAIVAIKHGCSSLTPEVSNFLEKKRVTTVILCGVKEVPPSMPESSGGCINVTAQACVERGYRTIIAGDMTNAYAGSGHNSSYYKYGERERAPAFNRLGIEMRPTKEIMELVCQLA
jgi:nicotinamidase-related amidase